MNFALLRILTVKKKIRCYFVDVEDEEDYVFEEEVTVKRKRSKPDSHRTHGLDFWLIFISSFT